MARTAALMLAGVLASGGVEGNPAVEAAGVWRALFANSSPRRVDFWSIALDGRDRRPLLTLEAFGDGFSPYRRLLEAGVPAVSGAVSGDGRWLAYRLDASPARPDPLWLANVHSGVVRLVATNVETFVWASQGARLLYSLAPPPRSPMVGFSAVMEGRVFRLHTADSGDDVVVAGAEREFVYAGPWADTRRLLFWRGGLALQLVSYDVERGTARKGHAWGPTNILQFGPRPGEKPWAVVTSEIRRHPCMEVREIDPTGRAGPPILRGCSYVCAGREACMAWKDENTIIVGKSERPDAGPDDPEWSQYYHPVSLFAHDVRTGQERRILDGSPSERWTVLASRPAELLLVKRGYIGGPSIDGGRQDCELQARTFDGRLLGTLYRGNAPPGFLGFIR